MCSQLSYYYDYLVDMINWANLRAKEEQKCYQKREQEEKARREKRYWYQHQAKEERD